MPMPPAEIRLLKNLDEFRACERIQMGVWGTLGASREIMAVTQKYGGAVLGTIIKGRVVGFVYAFLARYDGRLVHWSHMMAVEAKFRDQGFGFGMKLCHRKLALKRGLKSICWTYDPLQSRNAWLNLARLGAVVDEYVPDCYGHFPSVLEKGLPSDRLVVNWHITSARVRERLREEIPPLDPSLPRVNETRLTAGGFPENRAIRLRLTHPRLLVEIPARTDEMRSRALSLARRWRLETRRIFERYFSAGYRVEDFLPPQPATEGRCFYLLRRNPRG
jgi:predicted GNAT superfamily acetyltransferase